MFSENTRFRYKNYDRAPYIKELQKITDECTKKTEEVSAAKEKEIMQV